MTLFQSSTLLMETGGVELMLRMPSVLLMLDAWKHPVLPGWAGEG
jgi:hypothetical protein